MAPVAKKYRVYFKPKYEGEVGFVETLKTAQIPKRHRNKENAWCKLVWRHTCPEIIKRLGRAEDSYDAKILAIGTDEAAVNAIEVNVVTGDIIPPGEKAFSEPVMAARKKLAEDAKREKATSSLPPRLDFQLGYESPVFGKGPKKSGAQVQRPQWQSNHQQDGATATPKAGPSMAQTTRDTVLVGPNVEPELISLGTVFWHLDSTFCRRASLEVVDFVGEMLEGLKAQPPNRHINAIKEFLEGAHLRLNDHVKRKTDSGLLKPPAHQLTVPSHFFDHCPGKVQLFESQQFFVSPEMSAIIKTKTDGHPWGRHVDVILTEIYGDNLKWLASSGKRGSVGVHPTIKSGLLKLAQKLDLSVTKSELNNHINDLAGNRRASAKRSLKNKAQTVSKQVCSPVQAGRGSVLSFAGAAPQTPQTPTSFSNTHLRTAPETPATDLTFSPRETTESNMPLCSDDVVSNAAKLVSIVPKTPARCLTNLTNVPLDKVTPSMQQCNKTQIILSEDIQQQLINQGYVQVNTTPVASPMTGLKYRSKVLFQPSCDFVM